MRNSVLYLGAIAIHYSDDFVEGNHRKADVHTRRDVYVRTAVDRTHVAEVDRTVDEDNADLRDDTDDA